MVALEKVDIFLLIAIILYEVDFSPQFITLLSQFSLMCSE
jgi:hypothetical protein